MCVCVSALFTLYVLCVYMCVCASGVLKLVLGILLYHSLYIIILEEGFLGKSGGVLSCILPASPRYPPLCTSNAGITGEFKQN